MSNLALGSPITCQHMSINMKANKGRTTCECHLHALIDKPIVDYIIQSDPIRVGKLGINMQRYSDRALTFVSDADI